MTAHKDPSLSSTIMDLLGVLSEHGDITFMDHNHNPRKPPISVSWMVFVIHSSGTTWFKESVINFPTRALIEQEARQRCRKEKIDEIRIRKYMRINSY